MPIVLDDLKLSYTPVPKTACTSLKMVFFDIENGREFVPFRHNGREFHIHKVYASVLFNPKQAGRLADYRRLILVRDPIQRLLSAYGNRVVHHRELSLANARKELFAHDLAPDPGLEEFVTKLPRYMKAVESIDHHARPLVDFAGTDAAYYTRVYRMSEIEDMVADLSAVAGRRLTVGRLQTGGPKLSVDDLGRREIDTLRQFYAEDYRAFGRYFEGAQG